MKIIMDSMESDTFYGDFIAKVIWRLFGNFIHSPSLSMLSLQNLHANHYGNQIYLVLCIKILDKLHNFLLWKNTAELLEKLRL